MSAPLQTPSTKSRRRTAILVVGGLALAVIGASLMTRKKPATADADASAPPVVAIADAGGDAADASAHAALSKPAPKAASTEASELDPPPSARTNRPTDWSNAEEAPFNGAHGCAVVMKHEWFKITCPDSASVALLAGSRDGVTLDVKDVTEADESESFGPRQAHPAATAIFPVRRGDRRVLQFNGFKQGFNAGYSGEPDEQVPGLTLSELWLEDQRGPQIQLD